MLPRLEAQRQLQLANLAFATEGQAMDEQDRANYLAELTTAAAGGVVQAATYEDLSEANVLVVRENIEDPTGLVPAVGP